MVFTMGEEVLRTTPYSVLFEHFETPYSVLVHY
jgi:hypothetical protein